MNLTNRRGLLKTFGLAMCAFGARPCFSAGLAANKKTLLRLSLAAYSVRDLLTDSKSGWDLFRFVEYCRELGVSGAELTSYYFPKDITAEYLIDLKQHCHRQGVSISGGAIRNDFCTADPKRLQNDIDHTKRWIDHYAILGAPVIRIFAGDQPSGESWEDTISRCAAACREVAEYAQAKGLFLGLENHGGVTAKATGLLDILKRVPNKNFGVNFDSGNFRSTNEPYQELASIAPHTVNAQIKVSIAPLGKPEPTDLERVIQILRDANYSGWVALEYEEKEPALEAIPQWIEKLKPLVN
ncbi:sugar phosphate isomerase/epimerase family protein [Pirellulaceae bacterium SH449]